MAADDVTVNTVKPVLQRTPRVEEVHAAPDLDGMKMGHPEDFGAVVAFLCSDQARYTTGVQLHVEGGSYLGLL